MDDKLTPDRIEAAREAMRDHHDYYESVGAGKEVVDPFSDALAALDLAERMRWRDPKVELPPESGYVLASLQSDEFGVSGILRDIFYTGKKFDIDITETVLAWMPLPEWEGFGLDGCRVTADGLEPLSSPPTMPATLGRTTPSTCDLRSGICNATDDDPA